MKIQNLVAVFHEVVENDETVRRASMRDLSVLEGVLIEILDSVAAELRRRDQQQSRQQ